MKVQEALKAAIRELEILRATAHSDAYTLCKSALSDIEKCEPVGEVYAFEKWLKENTLIRASLNIDLDYADPLAEIAYRAWKARAKLNTEKG